MWLCFVCQNVVSLSLLSVITGLCHLRHRGQRHQEQSVQRGNLDHPQRGAKPQPRRRRWSVSYWSPLRHHLLPTIVLRGSAA